MILMTGIIYKQYVVVVSDHSDIFEEVKYLWFSVKIQSTKTVGVASTICHKYPPPLPPVNSSVSNHMQIQGGGGGGTPETTKI